MMAVSIGFTLNDILHYFSLKDGKVVYTEIVTYFKHALSDPSTQVEARNLFKDYVNTLATVTNENGTKYLVLRPKYMKKLPCFEELSVNNKDDSPTIQTTPTPTTFTQPVATTPNINVPLNNNECLAQPAIVSNQLYHTNDQLIQLQSNESFIGKNNIPIDTTDVCSLPTTNVECQDIPPRPPPRKKASFSNKTKSPLQTQTVNMESEPVDSLNPIDTNQEVKKEIQELAKTPGRVKEHAQILNKLTSNSDYKLPMPSTPSTINSVHTNVVNKIRNGFYGTDSDSGSVQIADSLKKKWIISAANCDYSALCAMLMEDSKLCSYCDFITGYNALHWAAKFNCIPIIKLIAGKYGVDPNIKSFSGSTPLHIAAQFKNENIIRLLVDSYGANKDIRDNYGNKPFYYMEPKEKTRNKNPSDKDMNNENQAPASNLSNGVASNSMTSTTESLKNNLRNKISHQSMLVRNKFRQSKAFQKRKSSFSQK